MTDLVRESERTRLAGMLRKFAVSDVIERLSLTPSEAVLAAADLIERNRSMTEHANHLDAQNKPTEGHGPHLFDEVIADFQARKVHGLELYGKTLQAFNGRRALIDLYQELVDGVMYTKQELIERDAFGKLLDRLTEKHDLNGMCCRPTGATSRLTQCTALAQIRVTAIQIGLIREE